MERMSKWVISAVNFNPSSEIFYAKVNQCLLIMQVIQFPKSYSATLWGIRNARPFCITCFASGSQVRGCDGSAIERSTLSR